MTNIKTTIGIIGAIIIITGLTTWAIYRDQNRPAPVDLAVVAANQRYSLAQGIITKDTAALATANTTISTLGAQKTTLCIQIKAAKLVQPLCP